MREQWLRRLLKNPLRDGAVVMAPLARQALSEASVNGQTLLLSQDQTDLGNQMAVLMLALRVGDRALPLGRVRGGRRGQPRLRGATPVAGTRPAVAAGGDAGDLVGGPLLPLGGPVCLARCARLGLPAAPKGNLVADPGWGSVTPTGDLVQGVTERYLPKVRLFTQGPLTHLGILHEPSHAEPWIIAMDGLPTRATVLDYATRWAIEPMFADFKSRGFAREDSQLTQADRLERLILVMALAMHGGVSVGRDDARLRPTPLEKNASAKQPSPLELQKTPAQPRLLVHPQLTPREEVFAKRHRFAGFLWGYEKLLCT